VEYCPGSLERILSQGRIQDEEILKKYTHHILRGLDYLHSHEIVHHDVKPSNILFDPEGVIKLVDFGAAELKPRNQVVPSEKGGFVLIGTARFLSPEAVRNERKAPIYSHDIWALGCTLLQMATGNPPWDDFDNDWAVMFQIGLNRLPDFPSKSEISDLGLEFIRACLTPDPVERPTAAQLLEHLWILDTSWG
jgi:mitogen-activated protein kinase kinase kinase